MFIGVAHRTEQHISSMARHTVPLTVLLNIDSIQKKMLVLWSLHCCAASQIEKTALGKPGGPCWWICTVQGWSLIWEIHKQGDQERAHANHIHGGSRVKMPIQYLVVRNINHHVDWMLMPDDHVSPQSIITQGAQITIRRMHSGHETEIHLVDSYVTSHCIERLRWAQRYSVTRAKPYSNSGLEPNSWISKLQTAPLQG